MGSFLIVPFVLGKERSFHQERAHGASKEIHKLLLQRNKLDNPLKQNTNPKEPGVYDVFSPNLPAWNGENSSGNDEIF
jgi:hypothetical protein